MTGTASRDAFVMNFQLTPELESFRQEVRDFLARKLPPELAARYRRGVRDDRDGLAWLHILHQHGWGVPYWPVEYGGTGWNAFEKFIFEDECHQADAPPPNWQGVRMVGPVVYTFGSPAQKERFLPLIRTGEYLWTQGFSEPGAGSDLASLKTRAVLNGDHYVVTGQKIWTSGAYHADWGFFLVRTDTECKPQQGISFLLIDMKTPGITVRRIPMINGDAHLCEVFLDEVKVPAENLIGEPGKGWTYAKFLLEHERTASAFIFWSKRELRRAKEMAETLRDERGAPLAQTPHFRERLLRAEADLLALEWSVLRVLAGESVRADLGAVCSGLKVRGSQLQQVVTRLQIDLLGARALRYFPFEDIPRGSFPDNALWPEVVPGRVASYLGTRASTIYGGALQVQKSIIAKTAFGL
jgi:alkylation response protein AidB-like acyl-CoA dehydrogenase